MENSEIIAVYNSGKKELVGLFTSRLLIRKYLFPMRGSEATKKIAYALNHKGKMRNTEFDFPVVLRFASKQQIDTLGKEPFLIFGEYPEPAST